MLRFHEDGTFTIVQFTDLHWQNGSDEDRKTQRLMAQILEKEQPDLAVVTGDVLSGRECRDPIWSWNEAVRPLEDAGVPWVAVFGNHDDEGIADRHQLTECMLSARHSLFEKGPEDVPGVGNFRLGVYAPKGSDRGAGVQETTSPGLPNRTSTGQSGQTGQAATDNTPARSLLYFFDSQTYAPEHIGGWGWVTHEQVAWYRSIAGAFHESERRALCFLHIPFPEYDDVWASGECIGSKDENVCAPKINTGLFAAFVEADEVIGVFAGHDHVNDYIGEKFGIHLAYGRVTGYNTYPRSPYPRGARVIRLMNEGESFETWLRLDDGRTIHTVQCGGRAGVRGE